MPCSDHVILLKATAQHGRERRPVSYLSAFGLFRLSRGVPRRLLSEAYQPSSQRSIPTTIKSGSSTLKKRWCVKLMDYQFGYFRLPRGLTRRTRHCRSRAGARHSMCELTTRHGRGTAWERHGRDMGTVCYVWIGLCCPSSRVLMLYSQQLAFVILFMLSASDLADSQHN
jgi:hypothetical protein